MSTRQEFPVDYNPTHRDFRAPAPVIPRFLAWLTSPVYTLGCDLSHWNSYVDFPALKAGGYDFVILKATEAVNYTDPTFSARWPQAWAAGLIIGTYHFLRMNYGGVNQAEHHLRTIEPLMEATDGHILPPACDVETADGVDLSVRQGCVRRFCATVTDFQDRPPLVYSSPYLWQTLTGNMSLDAYSWTAHWTAASAPSWLTGLPADKRKFWQWGTTKHAWVPPVAGVTGECDVNRFLGPLAELRAFAGITELSDSEKLEKLWNYHPELYTDA